MLYEVITIGRILLRVDKWCYGCVIPLKMFAKEVAKAEIGEAPQGRQVDKWFVHGKKLVDWYCLIETSYNFV